MSRKIIYRNQLLAAIEAFLEKTPAATMQAHRIIQRCSLAINGEDTLDNFIWSFYFHALKDSVYFESEDFLQETRELVLGKSSRHATRMVDSVDYSRNFTTDDAEWYALLVSMIDVLKTVPFIKISHSPQQSIKDWKTLFASTPEAAQIVKIDEVYQRKKALIRDIIVRNPSPENLGDEKIYHLVLREITSLLSEIDINLTSAYLGYPVLGSYYTIYNDITSIHEYPDITENLLWAKKILDALAGQGAFFLSWRLSKAPTFQGYALLISLH